VSHNVAAGYNYRTVLPNFKNRKKRIEINLVSNRLTAAIIISLQADQTMNMLV